MRFFVRSIRWVLAAVCALGLGASMAGPVAAQGLPGAGWSPDANATGDNTYNGFVDQPQPGATVAPGASFHVSGWIVDTSADGWAGIDDVQVLNGGTLLAHASVGSSRPDVAAVSGNPFWAASGFDGLVPSSGLPAGGVTLTVAAHTPGKGTWTKQVGVTIGGGGSSVTSGTATSGLVLTLFAPAVGEEVVANHNGVLRGTAFDTRTRDVLGVGVDRVQVYLDGPRGVQGSQNIGTATQVGTAWSLAWEPTRYDSVIHHVLFVYAHSGVTGEEVLLNREINIRH